MKNSKKTYAPLRWTFEQAASEFNLSPRTVSKRARAAGILPGADGKFSTSEISRAIFDTHTREIAAARRKKLEADARVAEYRLAQLEGSMVSVDEMVARVTPTSVLIRQKIWSSSIPEDERREILEYIGHLFSKAMTTPSTGRPKDETPNETDENTH